MGSATETRAAADKAETTAEHLGEVAGELDGLLDAVKALNSRDLAPETRAALAAAVLAFRSARKLVKRDHRVAERRAEKLSDEAGELELEEAAGEDEELAA